MNEGVPKAPTNDQEKPKAETPQFVKDFSIGQLKPASVEYPKVMEQLHQPVPFEYDMQSVIDIVRELFQDDELAEKILREPSFAKRVLEGEPFHPSALFDTVEKISQTDQETAVQMMSRLHSNGIAKTLFSNESVGFEEIDETAQMHSRADRLLYIALNKAGFREGELIKEEIEETMISRAIGYVNTIREVCGVNPIGLDEGDYSIIPDGSMQSFLSGETLGVANAVTEEMRITRKKSLLWRLSIIVHESLHFASDIRMSFGEGNVGLEHPSEVTLKSGLRESSIAGQWETEEKLGWLDEAVTEELSLRFIKGLEIDDPDFGDIVKQSKLAVKKFNITKSIIQLPEGLNLVEEPLDVSFGEDGKVEVAMPSYPDARKDFWELVKEIYQKNPTAFEGRTEEEAREQVFALIAKAKFTGNIVPFALLYDSAFGRGAFNGATEGKYDQLRSSMSREIYQGIHTGDLKIYTDDNFPGSTIVRDGNIGYALRKNGQGQLEGNQINYLEDGTIGPVYQLPQEDILTLQEKGIVDLALFKQLKF